ncbi:hypothetical protein SEA_LITNINMCQUEEN_102 [Gordonia phage LitninMcQueen]|nr:hypothetical protein SEA_HOLLIDAY_96 [Gordonia phage Holliday]
MTKSAHIRRLIEQFEFPGHTCEVEDIPDYKKGQRWLPTCTCGWQYERGVPSKQDAVTVWNRTHVVFRKQDQKPCPTPRKHRFKTRETAEREMRQFWRNIHKQGKPMPSRAYLCPCGYWHTTSKARRTFRKESA